MRPQSPPPHLHIHQGHTYYNKATPHNSVTHFGDQLFKKVVVQTIVLPKCEARNCTNKHPGKVMGKFLRKLKIDLPCDPGIPCHIPKESSIYFLNHSYCHSVHYREYMETS